jgi:hypothetical protein
VSVEIYERLTAPRVKLLGLLAANRSITEVAVILGCSYAGARSKVRDLKQVSGLDDARKIGRWWQGEREPWLAYMGNLAHGRLVNVHDFDTPRT